MKNRGGFTLMEVLTAIAVIAIISGPLLYLFVTSAKVGHHSYESDKANALAVGIVEDIKASPGNWTENGYGETADNPPVYTKTVYYDGNWNEEAASGAAYRADITVSNAQSAGNIPMSYIPKLTDSSGVNYNITVDDAAVSSAQCLIVLREVTDNGTDYYDITTFDPDNPASSGPAALRKSTASSDVYELKLPAEDCKAGVIPAVVSLTGANRHAVTFNVDNRTNREIGFYVYGDTDSPPHDISVVPLSGVASVNEMKVGAAALDYSQVKVNVTISQSDNTVIADYTTQIYLPEQS